VRELPLIAALAAVWAPPLVAQGTGVVYGSIRDTTGQPLRAAVTVVGGGVRTYADAQGRYRLTVASGRTIVRASHIGFASVVDTLSLSPGDSVERDYSLRPIAVELQPSVVTAAKRSQLLDQAMTSVAVISDTQVSRRAVNTVDEAVDKAPGVQFLNRQINIRGSTGYVQGLGSRVLLLVDGVPANQGDRGGINWDIVPLQDVERVEIVKGAGSALYGSAALGGVVNLITREIPAGFHGRVRATAGSYGNPPHDEWRFRDYIGAHEGIDVTNSYGNDRLRGSLTAGGWHSDGYREQDRRDHWQAAAKAEWRASSVTRVAASGSWASDQYEVPSLWCTQGRCDDRGQSYQPFMIDTSGRGMFTRSDKGYLAATVARTSGARLAWQARGSWLRTHFTDFQPERDDFGIADRLGAEFRAVVQPEPDRVVTAGAETTRSDVRTNIFTGDTNPTSDIARTHTQGEFAAYAESEQRVGRARLTAGARIDYIAVDGGGVEAVVSPRLGAVLETGTGVWRASAGRGFRAPALAERFVSTRAFGFQVIPNPGLDPETAWSFELGHSATSIGWARLDAALFWTEARELIEPTFILQDNVPKIQLQNVARARLRGLDLSVAAHPLTTRLSATLAYTLLDARDLGRDAVLPFRPRHLLTLGTDYTWKSVGVGGDFRYSSRIERIELEQFFGADPRIASRVLDLRARWERGPVSLGVLVTNALNYIYSHVPRTLAPVRTLSVILTWAY
jgi:outer membrane receptor for ferrienterochelin and colicins